MIKVQRAPLSFVYNKPGTNHYLVCYAPGDDMTAVFMYTYDTIKCNLENKNVKKG